MTPPTTSAHPGSHAGAVLPASQPARGVAIRRGRAGSPGAQRWHDLSLTGIAPVDRKLPASRLPIASFAWPTATR